MHQLVSWGRLSDVCGTDRLSVRSTLDYIFQSALMKQLVFRASWSALAYLSFSSAFFFSMCLNTVALNGIIYSSWRNQTTYLNQPPFCHTVWQHMKSFEDRAPFLSSDCQLEKLLVCQPIYYMHSMSNIFSMVNQ